MLIVERTMQELMDAPGTSNNLEYIIENNHLINVSLLILMGIVSVISIITLIHSVREGATSIIIFSAIFSIVGGLLCAVLFNDYRVTKDRLDVLRQEGVNAQELQTAIEKNAYEKYEIEELFFQNEYSIDELQDNLKIDRTQPIEVRVTLPNEEDSLYTYAVILDSEDSVRLQSIETNAPAPDSLLKE